MIGEADSSPGVRSYALPYPMGGQTDKAEALCSNMGDLEVLQDIREEAIGSGDTHRN